MAIIYKFPCIENDQIYPEFHEELDNEEQYTEEEINLQYDQYFQWQQDEYIFNQLMKQEQEQNAQKNRQTCLRDRFVRKIVSLFH